MPVKPDFSTQGVFIIHALKGYEKHEDRIKKLFPDHQLKANFITQGDPLHFTEDLLAEYFVPEIFDTLKTGIVSCTLNHFLACQQIVDQNLAYGLVFENDPFFLKSFDTLLPSILREAEKLEPGYLISLENSTLRFPSFLQTKRNQLLFRAKSGRMAGSYLIDYTGASRLLEYTRTNKCNNVIDWWHNTLADQGVLNIYWAQPAIVEQGSHNGRLNGVISTNKKSLWRIISWEAQKTYKYYFGRLWKQKDLI